MNGRPVDLSSGHLLAAASGCSISTLGKVTGLCTAKGSISIPISYRSILPLLILFGGALIVLMLVAVLPKRRYPGLWAGLTVLTGVATLVDGLVQWFNLDNSSHVAVTLAGQIIYDHFSAFFVILFGSATVLGAMITDGYLVRENLDGPEPYVLMMLVLRRGGPHGPGGRTDKPFPGPGNTVDLALYALGLPPSAPGIGRGSPQVLHPRARSRPPFSYMGPRWSTVPRGRRNTPPSSPS